MKKIKVSIKDESTLILLEDAESGDIIDLKTLHDVDIDTSTIENVVRSIKIDQFNAKLKEQTEIIRRENDLKMSLKEKEYAEKAKDALNKKDSTITDLN
jgi:hypothetical protein